MCASLYRPALYCWCARVRRPARQSSRQSAGTGPHVCAPCGEGQETQQRSGVARVRRAAQQSHSAWGRGRGPKPLRAHFASGNGGEARHSAASTNQPRAGRLLEIRFIACVVVAGLGPAAASKGDAMVAECAELARDALSPTHRSTGANKSQPPEQRRRTDQ